MRLTLSATVEESLCDPRHLDDVTELPISFAHAVRAGYLPRHHRDPFDRMLVAQARVEGLVLVSADPRVTAYEADSLSA